MGSQRQFEADVATLHAVLDRLGVPGLATTDGELRAELLALRAVAARVGWHDLARVDALDRRPDAVPGAKAGQVAATFLVHGARSGRAQGRQDVRVAAAVSDTGPLPALGAALAAGEVSRAHLNLCVHAIGKLPTSLLAQIHDGVTVAARVDEFLAQQCRVLTLDQLAALLPQLLAKLYPDGLDDFDPESYERRGLRMYADATGMVVGSFELDPVAGATVRAALDLFSAPNPARTAVDEDGAVVEVRDVRTKSQRDADALYEMARRTLADTTEARDATEPDNSLAPGNAPARDVAPDEAPDGAPDEAATSSKIGVPDSPAMAPAETTSSATGKAFIRDPIRAGGRIPAHVAVIATLDQLAALAGGPHAGLASCEQTGPIPANILARLLCDSVLHRVLTAPNGAVLDVGRATRYATAAQRKALTVRDRTCVVPGCAVPVHLCDVHHVVFWSRGGPTDLSNLAALCSTHHTAVHAGVWAIEVRDGLPWVVPPKWFDPLRRPLRNRLPEATQAALDLGREINAPRPAVARPGTSREPTGYRPPPGNEGLEPP